MGGVAGAEIEHPEQPDQPAPVVVGIGGLEDLALLALVLGPLGAVLGHEILQRRLSPDDREDHLSDGLIRGAQGCFGDLAQQRLLAGDAPEVLDELGDDLLLSVGIDPVRRGDQQLRQSVGDFPLTQGKQRAQQREPRRLRMLAQMHGRLDRCAGAPPDHDIRCDPGEKVGGQPDRADRLQLGDLGEHRLQAHVARSGLDQAQHVLLPFLLVVDGDERLQSGDGHSVQALKDHRQQRLLGSVEPGPDDLAHAIGGRRLDQLCSAASEQLLTIAIVAAFDRSDMFGQPAGQHLRIGHAALSDLIQ